MKYITKINLNENKTEIISMFSNAFTDKLEAMGIDPKEAIIKLCAETPKNEEAESVVKSILAHHVAAGYTFEGSNFNVFEAGSSDIRKATTTWLRTDLLAPIGKWAMCGLSTKTMKLAINKFMAYIGLLFSASKKFEDVFGVKINIRRVAIIKDAEVVVKAIADFVSAEKGVSHEVARRMVINAFDGFGIIRAKLTKGESCTLRGPWIKAFVQAINWSKLVAFCKSRGIELKFVDFWGVERQLKDVDVILTESCFKTAKLYDSWEQYCKAFEELGHDIRVCVREHQPKLKGLPYQQGQTLLGTEEDADFFANHAKNTMANFGEASKAHSLLSGYQKQAVKMYPALLNEVFIKRTLQEKYTTKRNDILGGRIPEMGYNAFLAPDLVAFAEHLFGLEIKGYLKAGECCCMAANEGLVDITRNPHFDNAHVVLNNVKTMPLAEGPTMFINIWDTTTIQLRADYDGDHVWYSQNEYLLNLVERTYATLKNLPIDWDVEKAEKVSITKAAIATFVTNLIHGSEIGLYADALTKMWNQKYDRDVCDWLTFAGNVLIDAAKHAAVKIQKPDAVKKLNYVSLPIFAMYAKADTDRPANTDYWLKERVTKTGVILPPRCQYTGSFLDMFSKKSDEIILEVLEISGTEDLIFDSTKLMINPHRKIGRLSGLCRKGIFDPEKQTYVECGLFQDIAFRHSAEWNKLVKEASFFQNRREWEMETAKFARQEIIDWARAQYPGVEVTDEQIEDACYDTIVRRVFNTKMSDGMDTAVKQAFWRIYGDKAVKVLHQNLNATVPEYEEEEAEDLCEIEG